MVSREHKRAFLHEKLQLLRSITNSHAENDASIILDASRYIQELKQKVESLNQSIGGGGGEGEGGTTEEQDSNDQNSWPAKFRVEPLEKGGFLVNVFSDKSCHGLLVSILEAFEELGLNVLEARVSCTHNFQLEALGGENNEENGEIIDAQTVEEAISQAIKNWVDSSNNE